MENQISVLNIKLEDAPFYKREGVMACEGVASESDVAFEHRDGRQSAIPDWNKHRDGRQSVISNCASILSAVRVLFPLEQAFCRPTECFFRIEIVHVASGHGKLH